MDLIAKLPVVAATIYNNLFREGATPCPIDPEKDWSHNYTSMIGYEDPMFTELMRLYLTIHRYTILKNLLNRFAPKIRVEFYSLPSFCYSSFTHSQGVLRNNFFPCLIQFLIQISHQVGSVYARSSCGRAFSADACCKRPRFPVFVVVKIYFSLSGIIFLSIRFNFGPC